jgi:hypothetical protein
MEPIKTEKPTVTSVTPVAPKLEKYVALTAIYHEGIDYREGDEIEVSEPLAAIWLGNGTIVEPPTK